MSTSAPNSNAARPLPPIDEVSTDFVEGEPEPIEALDPAAAEVDAPVNPEPGRREGLTTGEQRLLDWRQAYEERKRAEELAPKPPPPNPWPARLAALVPVAAAAVGLVVILARPQPEVGPPAPPPVAAAPAPVASADAPDASLLISGSDPGPAWARQIPEAPLPVKTPTKVAELPAKAAESASAAAPALAAAPRGGAPVIKGLESWTDEKMLWVRFNYSPAGELTLRWRDASGKVRMEDQTCSKGHCYQARGLGRLPAAQGPWTLEACSAGGACAEVLTR